MISRKTIQIFNKHLRALGVVEEEVPGEGVPPLPEAPPQSAAPKEMDTNERHVVKILTNAFIFNPSKFSPRKQKNIFHRIEQLNNLINVPEAFIIKRIKQIIALDKSLRVESKTLSLLDSYMLLVEQPADATEPQNAEQITPSPELDATNKADSENQLNLQEIFPLYKELILLALKHIPTSEELMIIKPIANEFGDIDPEKIVVTIKNLLGQSQEDTELQDNLSNA